MPWQQLTLRTTKEQAEALSDWFMSHDAVSVTFGDAADQALFEQQMGTLSLWQEVDLIVLFEHDVNVHLIIELFKQQFPDEAHEAHEAHEALEPILLPDQDWNRAWMDQFEPLQFGQRLWVCPSWLVTPNPAAINIMLDPGMAFGTGTHATTRLMLEWLEAHDNVAHLDVMDYGCGSGILAIAAAKLGCHTVVAVDNDPAALQSTLDNAQRNHISSQQLSTYLPEDVPLTPVDILLANILAEPLKSLASTLAMLVKPNGKIILSGILPEQVDSVASVYIPFFVEIKIDIAQGWARIVGTRQAH